MTELRYMKFTQRMCRAMYLAYTRADYGTSSFEWDRVLRILDTGKATSSPTRVDLMFLNEKAKHHLLDLMKIVEKQTCHKQLGDALRSRIATLNDHLGISAVDRLGDIL